MLAQGLVHLTVIESWAQALARDTVPTSDATPPRAGLMLPSIKSKEDMSSDAKEDRRSQEGKSFERMKKPTECT